MRIQTIFDFPKPSFSLLNLKIRIWVWESPWTLRISAAPTSVLREVHLREEVNKCFEFVGLRKKHKEVIEIFEGWVETTFQESLQC